MQAKPPIFYRPKQHSLRTIELQKKTERKLEGRRTLYLLGTVSLMLRVRHLYSLTPFSLTQATISGLPACPSGLRQIAVQNDDEWLSKSSRLSVSSISVTNTNF